MNQPTPAAAREGTSAARRCAHGPQGNARRYAARMALLTACVPGALALLTACVEALPHLLP